MAQGREMLATADLPDRHQRDLKALCWTMESLTEDSELEPFVEGIPGFIQTSSQCAPSAMVTLMHRDDIAIFGRVTKLLMTCMESGGLAGPSRRRPAVACMNAISALVMLVDNDDWTSLDFFDSGIGKLSARSSSTAIPLLQLRRSATQKFWPQNCSAQQTIS
jgi:hypothetical protein